MSSATNVAIIGAGPYGLSIAAHLAGRGLDFRIFGRPMQSWREGMPAGMHLKSDGFASSLYDPAGRFTLQRFCADRGLVYHATERPVPLETFVAYGLAFQSECVPTLEHRSVTALERTGDGFRLRLEDGSTLTARRVVIASGISHLGHVPADLAPLGSMCTHSSAHHDLGRFAGRRVLVIGAGASATDLAALLAAAGASVELVSRHPIEFHQPPTPGGRPWWQRLRRPHFGLGPSLRSTLCTLFPGVFRLAPERLRLRIVRRHLGPSGPWFVRDLIREKGVPLHEGYTLHSAALDQGKAVVRFTRSGGPPLELRVDHVIAATGYRATLEKLPFLDPALRGRIRTMGQGYPVLSSRFESSVPGLYFAGLLSAGSFGPLMRFALGARYTARRLGLQLGRQTLRPAPSSLSSPA